MDDSGKNRTADNPAKGGPLPLTKKAWWRTTDSGGQNSLAGDLSGDGPGGALCGTRKNSLAGERGRRTTLVGTLHDSGKNNLAGDLQGWRTTSKKKKTWQEGRWTTTLPSLGQRSGSRKTSWRGRRTTLLADDFGGTADDPGGAVWGSADDSRL